MTPTSSPSVGAGPRSRSGQVLEPSLAEFLGTHLPIAASAYGNGPSPSEMPETDDEKAFRCIPRRDGSLPDERRKRCRVTRVGGSFEHCLPLPSVIN